MAKLYFACVGINKVFTDGTTSLLMKVGESEEQIARGSANGILATMTVKNSALDAGLTVGAQGHCAGDIQESKDLKEDGTPWLRLRVSKEAPFRVTKKGNVPLGTEDIEFVD
jgi:hypothetical protein